MNLATLNWTKGLLRVYVVPNRDLVFSVAADSIPGGRQKFIGNVVLPAAIGLSEPVQCVAPGAP
jgi:hypothetical protein